MSLISWLSDKLGTRTPAPTPQRSYVSARLDRLSTSFGQGGNQSADSTLRFALPVLRARSRDLSENNDYVAGYLELLGNKIIGANGLRLQVKSVGMDGKQDSQANSAIEQAWKQWSRRGVCDISGRLSWVELQRLCLESMARDGEVFIRKIRSGNRFQFSLQLIEADMVDERKNEVLANGNRIRLGIELDSFDKPVAYHIFERHPGDYTMGGTATRTIRVPAAEIIHLYRAHRPGQTRGIPWTSAVMTRLHHIDAYEEAAIINARYGASKMGFFTHTAEAGPYLADGADVKGNLISEVEPGQLETLPVGYDFKSFDPAYPNNEYDPFIKRQLKGTSCGLPGATYADMSNDLESVNFSSIRQGTLNARDSYRSIQQLLIDVLALDVFEAWLRQALDFGQISITSKRGQLVKLSPVNYDKYNAGQFIGRGWEWVDPLKDENANRVALETRTTTRSRIAAECGDSFEDILIELAAEKTMAEQYGIDLEPQKTTETTGGPDGEQNN